MRLTTAAGRLVARLTGVLVVAGLGVVGATPAAAQSPITVISPHAGERVGTAVPYIVRWSASSIPGNARFVVYYTDGAGESREICSATASGRSCQWNEPDWFATRLFIDARNSSGVTLATAQSEAFIVEWENLPPEWRHLDIGNVGRSGGAWGRGSDTIDVRGAGADIWGTADAFHYAYHEVEGAGDFDATFTVSAVEGVHAWTKAGVTVRENLTPGGPHHSVFVTPGNGVAYQRRLTQNGTSLHTSLSTSSALPVRLLVMRRGNHLVIDMRRGDGPWQRVTHTNVESFLTLGMAVTSHDVRQLATATFTGARYAPRDPTPVQILSPADSESIAAGTPYTIAWSHSQPVNVATVSYSVDNGVTWTVVPGCASITATTCRWNNPGPATEAARIRVVIQDPNDRTAWGVTYPFAIRAEAEGELPARWVSGDVGAVAAQGSTSYQSATGQFAVAGSGADIWGTADEFHYVSRPVYDEGEFGIDITARVASIQNVNAWTKAGLMLRAHRGARAAHLSLFATPTTAKGIAFQRRSAEGASSLHTPGPSVTAPVWLKLVVKGGVADAYSRRLATDPWLFIGRQAVSLSPPYEAGLAVTSHADGTLAHATFDNVSITERSFANADIGAVGVAGATGMSHTGRTLWGSGADIWGTADAFRYHYGSIESTGVVSARVITLQPTDPWAKAGVMIRQDLSAGSPHVMLVATPGKGIAMQYRAVAGGASANVAIVPGAAAVWLRLSRRGGSVLGEASNDGLTWREIGRVEVAFGQFVTAGLAVTSHRNDRLARADFEDVILQP